MVKLNASEFRKQCLTLLDALPNEGLVIMKRGKPVAKLLPIREHDGDLIGTMKGLFDIKGDILSTDERWDAES